MLSLLSKATVIFLSTRKWMLHHRAYIRNLILCLNAFFTIFPWAQGQNICLVLKIPREGNRLRNTTKFVAIHFWTPSMKTTGNSRTLLDPALLASLLFTCSLPCQISGFVNCIVVSLTLFMHVLVFNICHTEAKRPLQVLLTKRRERTHSFHVQYLTLSLSLPQSCSSINTSMD